MSLTFRRHYKLLVLLAAVLMSLTLGLGDQSIDAYTVTSSRQAAESSINYAYGIVSSEASAFDGKAMPISTVD